jgi:Tfp pilus assembly protein PilE
MTSSTAKTPRRKVFGRTDASRRAARFMGARNSDGGFSFIELLAYMAIAALLILAAIPQFNKYREQATISTMQDDARNFAVEAEAIYTTGLAYPATTTSAVGGAAAGFTSTKASDGNVVYFNNRGQVFTVTVSNPSRGPSLKGVTWISDAGGLQKGTVTVTAGGVG